MWSLLWRNHSFLTFGWASWGRVHSQIQGLGLAIQSLVFSYGNGWFRNGHMRDSKTQFWELWVYSFVLRRLESRIILGYACHSHLNPIEMPISGQQSSEMGKGNLYPKFLAVAPVRPSLTPVFLLYSIMNQISFMHKPVFVRVSVPCHNNWSSKIGYFEDWMRQYITSAWCHVWPTSFKKC